MSDQGIDSADEATAAARARVAALFERLDCLTTDDLARIAVTVRDDPHRAELRTRLEAAAAITGRTALLAEARVMARDALLRRYGDGTYHPTWAGVNWGLSMGRAADRSAVVSAVEDAVGGALMRDALDPDDAEELTIDGGHVMLLATGVPDGPLRSPKTLGWAGRAVVAIVVVNRLTLTLAATLWYDVRLSIVVLAGVVIVFAGLIRGARQRPMRQGDG